VAAALYAFSVALRSPGVAVLAYAASFVCDELDGRFARQLNQCSTLGSGGCSWALGGARLCGQRKALVCIWALGWVPVWRAGSSRCVSGVCLESLPALVAWAHARAHICSAAFARGRTCLTACLPAVLDMVTDRLATTCLLAILAMRYPAHHLPCLALIWLDIFR